MFSLIFEIKKSLPSGNLNKFPMWCKTILNQPINFQFYKINCHGLSFNDIFFCFRLTKDLKELGKRRSNGVRFVMWQEIMNNNIQVTHFIVILYKSFMMWWQNVYKESLKYKQDSKLGLN